MVYLLGVSAKSSPANGYSSTKSEERTEYLGERFAYYCYWYLDLFNFYVSETLLESVKFLMYFVVRGYCLTGPNLRDSLFKW